MILLSGPNISGNEWKYVKDCLDTGWISSVGSYVTKFENMLAEFSGSKYGVATSNGTAALHISLILLDIKQGDRVIVPNLTFIASVNSIKYTGADPVFIDVDPNTWQMDLNLLESFLEENTQIEEKGARLKLNGALIKAIMPVHVLGNMCNMDKLLSIANKFNLKVVEDSTEALGSYYNGKHAGSFGELGCFSFNGNKIITCGGGGAIVTDNEGLAKKAKHLTTQAKADSFEYFHDEIGHNYRLVNTSAAIGVAQMEQLERFIRLKHEIKNFYQEQLSGVGDIEFQSIEKNTNPNWWLFTIKTERQKDLLKILNENEMQSRPFWIPMNQLPMFKNDLYVTENDLSNSIYQRCLSIPCSTDITIEQLTSISETIKKVYVQNF
ncbi:LegC family aminotransferase [uncultured Nitrosomonas sp.]|uniref:LegC family aminotransferase n=1 Tax=uncultured Nitrosomonas sp. TaxID=156424 RepID=UPI0025DF42DD|nr:LegC family aminotransferase [uncultured Nitrosomonas sp.]